MARIYEVIQREGFLVPTVRSDDEGWVHLVCSHRHHSHKEAERCLTKALPPYMKYRRNTRGKYGKDKPS